MSPQQANCLFEAYKLEAHATTNGRLRKSPKVGFDHSGYLGVATAGVCLRELNDRLARRGHLHGASHDPVREQLERIPQLQRRASQAVAHPVRFRCDPILGFEEGFLRLARKFFVLRGWENPYRDAPGRQLAAELRQITRSNAQPDRPGTRHRCSAKP